MQFIRRAVNWTPKTPIFYGWVTLIIGALGTYGATGSAQVTIAGIQTLIFEDTGWDRSTIAIGVTIGTWTAGFLTPIFGKLVDSQGPRWIMPSASLITGVCFLWIGGMSAVWHFYAAYIIARGLGNPALIGVVPRTVAVNFFHRKRNLALGIVSMARPCFGAINVQIIALIALWSSWRTAYRLLGAYSILLTVPLLIFMRRKPEDIGLRPDCDIEPETDSKHISNNSDADSAGDDQHEMNWTTSEAIRSSTLWFVISAEFLVILTSGTIGFQFVPYLKESGLSVSTAALAWSISSLMNAFSNPLWGFLSDRYSPRKLVLSAMPICIAITTLFLLIDGGMAGFFCVIFWGAASGGLNVLGGMMIANYYGRSSFGSISGIMGPFQIGGLGIGPTAGAYLYKMTGTYRSLFIFALTAYILALILFGLAKKPKLTSYSNINSG